MRNDSPLKKFDPQKLAYFETENYKAYYLRDWPRLLGVSVAMVKEAFGLNWLQAFRGAWLVARAEIAFAPYPQNDLPRAREYIRRFYSFIKQTHREDFDVERAAELELNWWSVHRRLFGVSQNNELAQALAALYAEAYGVEPSAVQQAAALRAQGMLYSDLWVNAGKPAASPLLEQERQALQDGYVALKAAINA